MNIEFDSSGGTKYITYAINCDAEVIFTSSDPSWLEINFGNGILTATTEPYTGDRPRTGAITPSVNNKSCGNKVINVTQNNGEQPGPTPECEVSRTYTISGNVGTIYIDACDTSKEFQVPVSSVTEYVDDCKPVEVETSYIQVTVTTDKNCGEERTVETVPGVYTVIQSGYCQDCECPEKRVTTEGEEIKEIKSLGFHINGGTEFSCDGGSVEVQPYVTYEKYRIDTSVTFDCHDEFVSSSTTRVDMPGGTEDVLSPSSHTFSAINCLDLQTETAITIIFDAEYGGKSSSTSITQTCYPCQTDCDCSSISITDTIDENIASSGKTNVEILSFTVNDGCDASKVSANVTGETVFINNIRISNGKVLGDVVANTGDSERSNTIILSYNNNECSSMKTTLHQNGQECNCDSANFRITTQQPIVLYATAFHGQRINFTKDCGEIVEKSHPTWVSNIQINNTENYLTFDSSNNASGGERTGSIVLSLNGSANCTDEIQLVQRAYPCDDNYSIVANPTSLTPTGGTVKFVCYDGQGTQELDETDGHWEITPTTLVVPGGSFGEFIFSSNTGTTGINYNVKFVHDFGCQIPTMEYRLPVECSIRFKYYNIESPHDVYGGHGRETGFEVNGFHAGGVLKENFTFTVNGRVDTLETVDGECVSINSQTYDWSENTSVLYVNEAGLGYCDGYVLSVSTLSVSYDGHTISFPVNQIEENTEQEFTWLM